MNDFWIYTLPVLVLTAMVLWNDLSTRKQLYKLEERIRGLEKAEEREI